jgi:hypothetical protein
VPACRGLAVAWLQRGASVRVLELGVPVTVFARLPGRTVFHGGSDDRGRSAQGLAYCCGDQRGGGAAGELRVRACAVQAERLLEWAAAWPERTWAVEGAGGTGHLLAQQLLSAGERVMDVQPKLGARVRLLAAGDVNKNDPNDARSVAVAALRSAGVREARPDDHAAVLKIWSKRHRDLGRTRTQVACGCTRCCASWSPAASRGTSSRPRRPPFSGRSRRGCGCRGPLRAGRGLHR